uniref:Uncharacterized protein n=1 Tax=Rhizophora mucronata TaxID=61149 RepID=A0A2P2NG80_RHIMU
MIDYCVYLMETCGSYLIVHGFQLLNQCLAVMLEIYIQQNQQQASWSLPSFFLQAILSL